MKNWPKDLLVKLIIKIEENTKDYLKLVYQKVYERFDKIYEGIAKVTPDRLSPMVSRCCFPGCTEVQVMNSKYDWAEDKMLNTCIYNCGSDIYYCDAHDELDYVTFNGGDVEPVCPSCKIEQLKRGQHVVKKDTDYTAEGKRKLREEAERHKKGEKYISNYYSMSKKELLNKVVSIVEDTKRMYEQDHQKELDLHEDIMRKISSIVPDYYFPSIVSCEFEDCPNFMVWAENVGTCYYNGDVIETCYCGNLSYCEDHLSHYSQIVDDMYCCVECRV